MQNQSEIQVEIVTKIRTRDRIFLTEVYRETYPMVEQYILTNSGTAADAQDIFQDAMYLLIKKAEDVNFELTAKVSTFLFGIGRNLWLKQLNKDRLKTEKLAQFSADEVTVDVAPTENDTLKKVRHIRQCLLALGEPCKTILEQFYFLKTPMKRIAEMLHYTNADNAKNQKYKCFMRLKKMVLKDNA